MTISGEKYNQQEIIPIYTFISNIISLLKPESLLS
jgi:hypothetical protein